jgi:hypothetical protein
MPGSASFDGARTPELSLQQPVVLGVITSDLVAKLRADLLLVPGRRQEIHGLVDDRINFAALQTEQAFDQARDLAGEGWRKEEESNQPSGTICDSLIYGLKFGAPVVFQSEEIENLEI